MIPKSGEEPPFKIGEGVKWSKVHNLLLLVGRITGKRDLGRTKFLGKGVFNRMRT